MKYFVTGESVSVMEPHTKLKDAKGEADGLSKQYNECFIVLTYEDDVYFVKYISHENLN